VLFGEIMNIRKIIMAASVLSAVGCVTTGATLAYNKRNAAPHYMTVPSAVGKIITQTKTSGEISCYGTLVEPGTVITAKHCIAFPDNVSNISFVTYDGEIHDVVIPLDLEPETTSLSTYSKDVAFLSLKEESSIDPISISSKSKSSELISAEGHAELIFPKKMHPSADFSTWRKCVFSTNKITSDALTSEECPLPKGHSGMPFIVSGEESQEVAGMYHGYIKLKSDSDENKNIGPLGVATLSYGW
jgi:hypothetical protein